MEDEKTSHTANTKHQETLFLQRIGIELLIALNSKLSYNFLASNSEQGCHQGGYFSSNFVLSSLLLYIIEDAP